MNECGFLENTKCPPDQISERPAFIQVYGKCDRWLNGENKLEVFHVYSPVSDWDYERMTGDKLYRCSYCNDTRGYETFEPLKQ